MKQELTVYLRVKSPTRKRDLTLVTKMLELVSPFELNM